MAKVRIFEWAKENNRRSNEIVKKLKDQGENVRNHTSLVESSVLEGLFGSGEKKEKRHFSTGQGTRKESTDKESTDNNEEYNKNNRGGYNRDNRNDNRGGYNQNRGGYNQNRGGYNRDNQNDNRGGYNQNRGGYNQNRGGYNRDNQNDNRGGYNRDNNQNRGGYNRDNNQNRGGYNRDNNQNRGGYNRDNNNQNRGGYNQNRGGYNRDNQNDNRGGYNQNRGGYNRDNNQNRGGYNRDNNNQNRGGYNQNRGGYNRDNNNQNRGGYNRDNNNQNRGGYNRNGNDNRGGYNRNNNFNGNKRPFNNNRPGAKTEELEPTTNKPTSKKGNGNKKRHQRPSFDRFAMFDNKEGNLRGVDQKTKTQLKKEARAEREQELKGQISVIKWADEMTISKFASLIDIPANDVISKLFVDLGILATMNQQLDKETAEILCTDYNVEIVEDDSNQEFEFENLLPKFTEDDTKIRPAIVTIMGHVDHGKTTLLDTIRNANVTAKESGGITQHIGAYQIKHNKGAITFLDTPGHAAFTAMRARGAQVTDITVLVVAADDGVMPQTREAIAHAKDAKTPLIVAVNKMDKPDAAPDRVMSELAELGVMSEDWGGDTPFVNISALKGEGIDELLDYIEMISEMHEYKAPYDVVGYGTVIEANLDKGRGSVATILVQGGEVSVGDPIVIGHTWGSIRVMQDEYGKRHRKVGPSMPVEITGLKDVPQAGDQFVIMKDAKEAQTIGEKRSELKAQKDRSRAHAMSLEELNAMIAEGDVKELPVVIKADVQGSVEALAASLEQIEVNGVNVRVVHRGVGAINESDVMLATAGSAILIGFNVRPDANARQLIEKEKIDLMLSNIIYKIIEEIEDSMKGMREKKYRQEILGYARVDEVFKITGVGKVAGCVVTSGKITRECKVRLVRDGVVIYDGDLGQLKRYKDDVKEVIEGMDCGMSFKDFNDIKKGDEFEGYILEEEDLD